MRKLLSRYTGSVGSTSLRAIRKTGELGESDEKKSEVRG